MKLALAALALFCVLGLSKLQAGPAVSTVAASETASEAEEAAVGAEEAEAFCPMQWTCNFRSWYTSESACRASCSNPNNCELEYHCSGGCVCP